MIPEDVFLNGPDSLYAFQPDVVTCHHPPSYLQPEMRPLFYGRHLGASKLLAFGHVHELKPELIIEDGLPRLKSQAPALFYRSHRDSNYKGYSIITIDRERRVFQSTHFQYYPKLLQFDLAVGELPKGVYTSSYEADEIFRSVWPHFDLDTLLSWSGDELYNEYKNMLEAHIGRIGRSKDALEPHVEVRGHVTSISPDVVLPRQPETLPLNDLMQRPDNVLITAPSEGGKTTALLMWALRRCEDPGTHDRIAVYAKWSALPKGPNAFLRLVKRSAPNLPGGMSWENLLDRGLVEVLIDDFPVNRQSVDCLQEAVSAYPGSQFVVAYASKAIAELGFASFVPETVPFLSTSLTQLRRGQIRTVVKKYVSLSRQEEDSFVRELVRELQHNNLPISAFMVYSIIEIYSTDGSIKFTNKAAFVERLLEIKLERFAVSEIRVGAFDFDNKVRVLADIAGWMVENDRYVVSENEIQAQIKLHLDKYGFPVRVSELLERFYAAGVLVHSRNEVRFGFMCYLEFFISRRMCFDNKFRDWILSKDNYLSFQNEIVFYFSTVREGAALLDEIASRLEAIRNYLKEKQHFSTDAAAVLDKIELTRGGASDEELEQYERRVRSPQLSDEERDELLDAETPKDVGGRQEVFRPKLETPEAQWLYALLLYSALIRSSDFLLASEKELHIKTALVAWSEFLQFSLNIVPRLAEVGTLKIDEVEYMIPGLLELEMADRYRLLQIMMPVGVMRMIGFNMNSDKLRNQIRSTIDNSEPGFLSLLRLGMLLDISYQGVATDLRTYMDQINKKSSYAHYVALRQATEAYIHNRLDESDRRAFGSVVGETVAKLKGKTRGVIAKEKSNVLTALEKTRLQISARDRGSS